MSEMWGDVTGPVRQQFYAVVRDLLALELPPEAWPTPQHTRALAARIVAEGKPVAASYPNGDIIRHDPVTPNTGRNAQNGR